MLSLIRLGSPKTNWYLYNMVSEHLKKDLSMDFKATSANPLRLNVDCLIVLTDGKLSHTQTGAHETLFAELRLLVKAVNFDGKHGSVEKIHTPTMPFKQIIFVMT